MSHAFRRFLPDQANRQWLPAFVAFSVAAVGVALGFLAPSISLPWVRASLAILALAMTVAGVVAGFIIVLIWWWRFFRRLFRGEVSRSSNRSNG